MRNLASASKSGDRKEIEEEEQLGGQETFFSPIADRPQLTTGRSKLKLSEMELGLDLRGSTEESGFKLFLFENDVQRLSARVSLDRNERSSAGSTRRNAP